MGCASSSTGSVEKSQPQAKTQAASPKRNPPAKSQEPEEKTDIKIKKVKLDNKVLEQYLKLEQQSRELESKNVIKTMKAKEEEEKDLTVTITQLEQHYQECITQTDKEKADVDHMKSPSVKNFFKQQSDYDAKFSTEEEEYLEALNKQEIAQKELEGVKHQRDKLKKEIKDLHGEVKQLQKIYEEQDILLASIFNGKYGSELEYKLESEMDLMMDRKQRISVAKYKWSNARVLLQHAVNQMAVATKRWAEVTKVPVENVQSRYTLATDARNNIIAATQNITSAQRYLHTIQFPYCKPAEVETLNRAVNNIYTDMVNADRHEYALQCYTTSHKRSSALCQWFDHVINTTISNDLEQASKNVDEKEKALRQERLRLIKLKIQDSGNTVNMDLEQVGDLGPASSTQRGSEAQVTEADRVSNAGDLPGSLTGDDSGQVDQSKEAQPLSLLELAPAPNNDELFGDIDELKKQHEQEMDEFNKTQDVNKARMEQGLQEKLRARRSRQRRSDAQHLE